MTSKLVYNDKNVIKSQYLFFLMFKDYIIILILYKRLVMSKTNEKEVQRRDLQVELIQGMNLTKGKINKVFRSSDAKKNRKHFFREYKKTRSGCFTLPFV